LQFLVVKISPVMKSGDPNAKCYYSIISIVCFLLYITIISLQTKWNNNLNELTFRQTFFIRHLQKCFLLNEKFCIVIQKKFMLNTIFFIVLQKRFLLIEIFSFVVQKSILLNTKKVSFVEKSILQIEKNMC
jgi:hypothetical protein